MRVRLEVVWGTGILDRIFFAWQGNMGKQALPLVDGIGRIWHMNKSEQTATGLGKWDRMEESGIIAMDGMALLEGKVEISTWDGRHL